jgi:hypothetical protein
MLLVVGVSRKTNFVSGTTIGGDWISSGESSSFISAKRGGIGRVPDGRNLTKNVV